MSAVITIVFNVFFTAFVISATNEIPEDQARHHLGAVLHQRLAGEQLRPFKVRLCHKERVIRGFSCLVSHQARKLLRELKYQKRCEEAATTIAAYWHGTQVLELWRGELIVTAAGLWIHLPVWNFGFSGVPAWRPDCVRDPRTRPDLITAAAVSFLFPSLFCWSHNCHFSSPSHCSLYHFSFHSLFSPSTCLAKHPPHPDRLARSWDV